ncbi:MAG: histidine ammonia-lyase [Candidatus Marinimicrobia bacterium CG08_land_8_20_14_0_20_45_22]|nr:MAG: histidine ammonia-lyase [Candidatus Marinimicrobia bacterium CG08_land_8_20_14_0_20_45_22]
MLEKVTRFLNRRTKVTLSESEMSRIQTARQVVLEKIQSGKTIYGINTGFGKLAQVNIPADDLEQLQINLLRSHACGVGKPIDSEIVALMMFLKVKSLAMGFSGCSLEIVQKMVEFLNKDIFPIVPARGSVGASGDLAPLAHLCLPLIGEGEVFYNGQRKNANELIDQGIYKPVRLGPKDGLSLINGTQYSTALLTLAFLRAQDIILLSELAAAMSVEAILATDVPFRSQIHEVRRQSGEQESARHIRNFLRNSEIVQSHKNCPKVQDPYSFRCAPQVIGVVRDVLQFVEKIVENELSAVTDNPLVFAEAGEVLSGGNFHAEPLAMAADFLSIALAELANIAERRISNLVDPAMSGLPAFLTQSGGVNSGFMIAHVTSAALCAENRTLSTPASVETIPTSANQEDHVSMAPNACLKLFQIVENTRKIVWIELLASAQGMDFRKPLAGGIGTRLGHAKIRSMVKHLDEDRIFYPDLEKSEEFFSDTAFIETVRRTSIND